MDATVLIARSGNPRALLASIRAAIDKGNVSTRACDKDGDFIHTPTQWAGKGWLRPNLESGALVLTFIVPKQGVDPEARGVYLGRFAEMLVNHFAAAVSSLGIP